ncbi:MAG TPA: hypothetical protein PLQ34_07830 [Ferrovaceae bacterium]|nr:hypothetical protein [Ferrovaceae bacterium]
MKDYWTEYKDAIADGVAIESATNEAQGVFKYAALINGCAFPRGHHFLLCSSRGMAERLDQTHQLQLEGE